jgi:DNA polymerase III delta prime subunit
VTAGAIRGNAEITKFLLGLARSRTLGHAYLFSGPEGVGKKLVALEFARAVNCRCAEEKGECESCRLMRSLSHPELLLLEDLTKPRWIERKQVTASGPGEAAGPDLAGLVERLFEDGYLEEPLPRVDRPMAVDGFNLVTDKLFGRGSVPSKESYTPGPASEEIRRSFEGGDVDEVTYKLLRRLYEYPLSVMPYRGAIPIAYVASRKGWKFTRPIQPFLSVRSMLGGKKTVIIDDAHKMSAEAQNCLLKTLEEPPDDSLLILVTSDKQALYQTIVSRCQMVNFSRPARAEMDELVRDLAGKPDGEIALAASLAENCPGRFLELVMSRTAGRLEAVRALFSAAARGRLAPALGLSRSIIEEGGSHRRKQRRAVTEALELTGFWLSKLARVKAGLHDDMGIPEYTDALAVQASAFDKADLFEASRVIEDALPVVRFNVDMRLLLDTTLLRVASVLAKAASS